MNKRILLGVTGGIAIYKTLDLISRLKKRNVHVDVIMTRHAMEFVTPLTFETMARAKVHTDGFDRENPEAVEHIQLAKDADVFLIAPATANCMAKLAHGIADDLLSTTALAATCPLMLAPAMNTKMLKHPATQKNMQILAERGAQFIASGQGFLACNEIGEGRMAEPVEILQALRDHFTKKDLQGLRLIVTAGGTRESLDPVRYLTNHSSGKMGWHLAHRALLRGAEVIFITAASLPALKGAKTVRVHTTMEMLAAVQEHFADADGLLMAAAPSDYRPAVVREQKIKKSDDTMTVEFVRNPDILKTVTKDKTHQFVVAFAAETENLTAYAAKKRQEKKADLIVANDVTQEGAGFATDTNIATLIDENGEVALPKMRKAALADRILTCVLQGKNASL